MPTPKPASTLTPDSFNAIANETRLSILHALWTEGESTFIELFDAVTVDDTGQFTYHLNHRLDQFALKVDSTKYRPGPHRQHGIVGAISHVEEPDPKASGTKVRRELEGLSLDRRIRRLQTRR